MALHALKCVLQNPSEELLDRFARKRVIGTRLSDDKKALIVPLSGVFGIQAAGLVDVSFALTVRNENESDGDFSESEGHDAEEPSSDTEGGDAEEKSDAEDSSRTALESAPSWASR